MAENTPISSVHMLAHLEGEPLSPVATFWEYFDPQHMQTNMTRLRSLATLAYERSVTQPYEFTSEEREQLLTFISAESNLQKIYSLYQSRFATFTNAPTDRSALTDVLPTTQLPVTPEQTLEQIKASIIDILGTEQGNVFFVSNSHATLFTQLEALQNLVGPTKLGLIVIDRHGDIIPDEAEDGLAKANVVKLSLDANLITAGVILGMEPELADEVTSGSTRRTNVNVTSTHQVFETYKNRLSFSKSTAPLQEDIIKQIQFLKDAGVTHIVISFDIDALDSGELGTTAMEYSPLERLVGLTVQDFSTLDVSKKMSNANLLSQITQVMDILHDPLSSNFLRLDEVSLEDAEALYSSRELATSLNGLTREQVREMVTIIKNACLQSSLQIGVPLPQGGVYMGDATEYGGYDWNEETAKVIANFISSFS